MNKYRFGRRSKWDSPHFRRPLAKFKDITGGLVSPFGLVPEQPALEGAILYIICGVSISTLVHININSCPLMYFRG